MFSHLHLTNGSEIFVNLSQARTVWKIDDSTTEIVFMSDSTGNGYFICVRESADKIANGEFEI